MRHLALGTALLLVAQPTPAQTIQRLAKSDQSGTAWTVRAPDGPLLFTGMIRAPEPVADTRTQAAKALLTLDRVLADSGSDTSRVLRLNAYVASDADVAAVETAVAEHFAAKPPAFMLLCTPLTTAGARVAFEAVASSGMKGETVQVRGSQAAILPAGGKVFLAGQAETGTDVASATRATMSGVHRILTHLGLKQTDVVQVKVFLAPFVDHAAAVREVAASFAGAPVPPLVLVEWVSTQFVEIEVVASARALPEPAGDKVAYHRLPWATPSPRYSEVCHVGAGVPLIFIGAIHGEGVAGAREQMKVIFERLGSVLFDGGSSYRNLIKATYYLGDPTARPLLGEIRGVYYDPTRAPAASALGFKSLGRPARTAQLDLIAFPVK